MVYQIITPKRITQIMEVMILVIALRLGLKRLRIRSTRMCPSIFIIQAADRNVIHRRLYSEISKSGGQVNPIEYLRRTSTEIARVSKIAQALSDAFMS